MKKTIIKSVCVVLAVFVGTLPIWAGIYGLEAAMLAALIFAIVADYKKL